MTTDHRGRPNLRSDRLRDRLGMVEHRREGTGLAPVRTVEAVRAVLPMIPADPSDGLRSGSAPGTGASQTMRSIVDSSTIAQPGGAGPDQLSQ